MNSNDWTSSAVASAEGTTIAYEALGSGPGLIVVGGVLGTARLEPTRLNVERLDALHSDSARIATI